MGLWDLKENPRNNRTTTEDKLDTIGNIHQAAMLVVMVSTIFAGVAIPPALRAQRRDAELARQEKTKSEGTE